MAQELLANSAATVVINGVVSMSDGTTPVETLDFAACDVGHIFKNNAVTASSITANSLATVAIAPGSYMIGLASGDLDTPGTLDMTIQDDSLIAPVFKAFTVVSEYEWNRKYGTEGVTGGKLSGILTYGTAASISDTAIELASSHGLDDDDRYVITLTGGTAAYGRSRVITNDSANTYTVDPAWNTGGATTPSGTVTYVVLPIPINTTTSIPNVNAIQISGDATAADNLEAACDGNTYNVGGGAIVAASVSGAVGSVTGDIGGIAGQTLSDVTIRVDPIAYSGLTVEVNNIAPASYSGVTVAVDDIAPAAYSGVTVGIDNIAPASLLSMSINTDGNRYIQDVFAAIRNKVIATDSTVTVYAGDDATVAWSGTVTRSQLSAIQTIDPS